MPRAKRDKQKELAGEQARTLLANEISGAIAFLVALMQDEKQKPELRMKAAESILDRACGKAGASGTRGEGGEVTVRFEGELDEWSQ